MTYNDQTQSLTSPAPTAWTSLGITGEDPAFLAPLAGVSDAPFRRLCSRYGAALTYVEMLSATALLFESRRTYEIMIRHPAETRLGVQLTGKSADETARAVAILDKLPYETIDINMGCPVTKVVKSGCGSAILRDPKRVYETVKLATGATAKPLSVKIRLGWDKQTYTYLEVADAAQQAGAAWLTIHGRLRCDDYGTPVDLERMAELKAKLQLPVIGNGNVFGRGDADYMRRRTAVDGVMVSRGALGNPWIFREIATGDGRVGLAEWRDAVLDHLQWQQEAYGGSPGSAVCMRKHLLWYMKGWPGAKRVREQLAHIESLPAARSLIEAFAAELQQTGCQERLPMTQDEPGSRFVWDPKYEMDRQLDRGVGDDQMTAPV